ncbi:MAG: F0F1 ATP synthase subunit C [Erysipelotrichaceae bacterium]|nr:F0F1 ATP synthase subunit C [Erysipelotrichaceae bacterium]
MERGLIAIAATLAVWAGFGTAFGEASVARQAVESIGKNPEASDKIRSMAIVGAAISETVAIYGTLISMLLIFVFH